MLLLGNRYPHSSPQVEGCEAICSNCIPFIIFSRIDRGF